MPPTESPLRFTGFAFFLLLWNGASLSFLFSLLRVGWVGRLLPGVSQQQVKHRGRARGGPLFGRLFALFVSRHAVGVGVRSALRGFGRRRAGGERFARGGIQ